MTDELDTQKAHRYFAAEAFNECWKLIDKPQRDAEDIEQMLRLAETSAWHWQQFEGHTAENLSIAYWQLARVYAIADHAGRAVQYAERCVAVTEAGELGPFCLGYGFEALARAQQIAGIDGEWPSTLELGYMAADKVSDEASREQLLADLATVGPRS